MQKSIIIALSLLIVLQSASAWDYLVFVQEPAGNICLTKSCVGAYSGSASGKVINMHGMWPNNNDGSYPTTCTSEQYDPSQIDASILSYFDSNWVGLYSDTTTFRNHEWTKHGTCYEAQVSKTETQVLANSFLSKQSSSLATKQNDYFTKIMNVKKQYDLTSVIYNDSYQSQSGDYVYQTSNIRSQIASVLGVNGFYLKCQNVNGVQYLIEIWNCLDQSLSPINCPNAETDTCTGSQIHTTLLNVQSFAATN